MLARERVEAYEIDRGPGVGSNIWWAKGACPVAVLGLRFHFLRALGTVSGGVSDRGR